MITGRTDRRTDRVQRNMRPPPREEGRIIIIIIIITITQEVMDEFSLKKFGGEGCVTGDN